MKYSNKKNFIFYNIQNIIVILVPLLSVSIFTRIFSPEQYGLLALAILFGNISSTIINFGFHNAYETFYFKCENKNKKEELFNTLISFNIITFLALLIPVYFFIDTICYLFNVSKANSEIFLFGYLASNLRTINDYFLLKARNEKDSVLNSILKIGVIVFHFLLSIIFVIYLNSSIEGLVFSQFYSNLFWLIVAFFLLTNRKLIFKTKVLLNTFKFSIPLFPRILTGVVSISYDKLLINILSSAGSLGIYDIATRVSYQCINFFNTLQNTFLPDFYKMANNRVKNQEKIPKFLMKYFFIAILFCQLVCYFSYEITSIITPKEFHEAITIITILGLAMSLIFFGTIPILIHLKKTFLISKLSVLSLIITLIIVVFFTQQYGILGTAIGILISNIITQGIAFIKTYMIYPLRWDFKNILFIYLYLFLSSFVLIFLREIELFYLFRLAIKLFFIIFLLYYGNRYKIFHFQAYFNEILNQIKNTIYFKSN